MNIVIHPKVKKAMIVILIISMIAIVSLTLHPFLFPKPEVTDPTQAADAKAAVDAVMAFYTLDSSKSPELWANRVCAHTSEDGCRIVRSYFAPTMQILLQENSIQTGCTVLPVRLVEDDGGKHIWQVSVRLDHPWADLDAQTQTVFVEMSQENGKWLMNRILFEQEVERSTNSTP